MYDITTPDQKTKNYARLADATKFADKFSLENGVEIDVIHAETGAVAYVATPVRDRLFHPWERVETPKHIAPHFEGFRPAYTRRRIEATVYRNLNERSWRVYDGRTQKYKDVANTTESRHLLTAMKNGLLL